MIVDVRTAEEYAGRHIPGALLIPIDDFAARVQELDPEEEQILVCEHGIRSTISTHFLRTMGFRDCVNMRQGMSGWRGPVEGMMGWAAAGGM